MSLADLIEIEKQEIDELREILNRCIIALEQNKLAVYEEDIVNFILDEYGHINHLHPDEMIPRHHEKLLEVYENLVAEDNKSNEKDD